MNAIIGALLKINGCNGNSEVGELYMGVAINRQEEAIASSWNLPNIKTTRLINCVVCRKPKGG